VKVFDAKGEEISKEPKSNPSCSPDQISNQSGDDAIEAYAFCPVHD
jgi:hypothetical protein